MSANLCECGCLELVNAGKRFVRMHHLRAPEVRSRMGRPFKQERNEALAVRYAVGRETLDEIAADHGFSRERARQIVRAVEAQTGFSAHEVRKASRVDWPQHKPTDLERFFENVRLNHDNGCWEWTGFVNPVTGYASFRGRGQVYAHRFAVVAFKNPAAYETPDRMVTDHLCRNPACVNPDHLEVVTYRESVRRGARAIYAQPALVQMLRWLALRLDRSPTGVDVNDMLPCSVSAYNYRWGSMAVAHGVVGLTPNTAGRPTALPASFRRQHSDLLQFLTPEEVADAYGGLFIENAYSPAA